MRAVAIALPLCLALALTVIAVAASAHVGALRAEVERTGEQRLQIDLQLEAVRRAAAIPKALDKAPIVARYASDGALLKPKPPAEAPSFDAPAVTPALLAARRGEFERAEALAQTSAERALVQLARGEKDGDPKRLRRALEERALAGTDLGFWTELRAFRLENVAPTEEWLEDVRRLQDGKSYALAHTLLSAAGATPDPAPERRTALAALKPAAGVQITDTEIRRFDETGDGFVLRVVPREWFDDLPDSFVAPLPAPFEDLAVRANLDRDAIQDEKRSRRHAILFQYGAAAALVLAAGALSLVAYRRAIRLANEKSAFVANVTHELKTPLANIRLYAESLRSDRVQSKDQEEFLDTILSESHRLEVLVEGILHVARGAHAPGRRLIPATELIDGAEERWEKRLRAEAFEFVVRREELPPVAVDEEAVGRAVDNLLDNARKYSRDKKEIELSGCVQNGNVLLTVRDRGPGIPASEQAHVTKPFARLEGADRKETPGAGLGLSLAEACMQAHGGRLEIRNRAGGGAEVSLVLPTEEGT
ncbi:MAG: HAMP domain-containing sensor histidine kinase [Planctomycetota bacterium]